MDNRIFTIVVPIFNAENTIERTLASFISNKDFIYEVILVNDRSTDDTFSKIEPFKAFYDIKVVQNAYTKGAGTARKTGIKKAKGQWITFVDADDCLTHSSLKYVYDNIKEEENLVLLHTQTIYYESGDFKAENIEHSDNSCGGNFYKREYLIDNELYPHETLYMVEDEYFNEKVIKYINHCDENKEISYYNYPVYEVHHDIEQGLSFALSNWSDYCCKYHLLYKEYITSYFIKYKNMRKLLLEEYMNNFIFVFYMMLGLTQDDEIEFKLEEYWGDFKRSLQYYEKTFKKNRKYLIKYFYNNEDNRWNLKDSAMASTGIRIAEMIDFKNFVEKL